jgi:hypothetical protein
MKVGRVALLKKIDELVIPDEFNIDLKQDGEKYILEINEFYHCDEETFRIIEENTKKDDLLNGNTINSEFKNGVGRIEIQFKGDKKELLERIFREILLQLQFYIDEEEIKEILEEIKVFEIWEVN